MSARPFCYRPLVPHIFTAFGIATKTRQGAVERGDTINIVPSEELAKWQEATEAALGKRARELDGRGLRGESLVGKTRELLAEYDTAN